MTIPADTQLMFNYLEGPSLAYVGPSGKWRSQLTVSTESVSYDLSFLTIVNGVASPDVDGLAASDFTVVTTGTATADVASVEAFYSFGQKQYRVTLNHISGDGTVTLELAEPGHVEPGHEILPLTIDTTPPELLSTTILTPTGDYANGGQISFEVAFSERMAVHGGVPSLLLSNGAEAVYAGGSGTGKLLFTYAVAPNQAATDDLEVVGFNAHGATTRDVAGNDVDWADLHVAAHDPISVHPGAVAVPHFTSLTVETNAAGNTVKAGDTVTFILAIEHSIDFVVHFDSVPPTLSLSNGAVATFTGLTAAGMEFAYTVDSDDANGPLSVTGLNMNNITVQSHASNGFDAAQQVAVTDGGAVLRPTSVYLADLDGDGDNDIVTMSPQDHKLSVLLGHGDGSFDAAVNYDVGVDGNGVLNERQKAAVIADINGDGILDIATAGVATVSVLLGNGDGTFAAPVQTRILGSSQLSSVYKLSTIDLGDAGTRLVVDGAQPFQRAGTDGTHFDDYFSYTSLNVFTSDAAGLLTLDNTMSSVPIVGGIHATLIDIDSDGRLDIAGGAYANETAVGYVYHPPHPVVFNDPYTGEPITIAGGVDSPLEGPGRIAVTYGLDAIELVSTIPGLSSPWGDGVGAEYYGYDVRIMPEVTTAARLSGTLTWVISAGDHRLSVNAVYPSGVFGGCIYATGIAIPLAVETVDVNGDGALDIVVAGFDDNLAGKFSIFYNEGNGHFLAAIEYSLDGYGLHNLNPNGQSLDAIALGDIDGDGRPDLVSAAPDASTPGVVVQLNHSAPAVPFDYTSLTPLLGQTAVAIDTIGPAAPQVALAHDTGVSGADEITRNPTLTITPAENGGTLLYQIDEATDVSATAPAFATDGSADGLHTILVQQRDNAGNLGGVSFFSFTLDTLAPELAGIRASSDHGAQFAGSTVSFTLAFDEEVGVAGGTPWLTLNNGAHATYNAAATAALHDATQLVFDYLVSDRDPITASLAVTGLSAHGATVADLAGNQADLSDVAAAFSALSVNASIVAPQTFGGFTRPELHLDASGHIILDGPTAAAAAAFGSKFLYMGLPADTPYPPVDLAHADFHLV